MADKIYTIESLERGTKQSRKGKTLDGLWFSFTNHETGKTRKEFLMSWKSGEVIQQLEEIGEGTDIHLDWEKNGDWYNIIGVRVSGSDKPTGAQKPEHTTTPPAGATKYTKPDQKVVSNPAENIRITSLGYAIKLTDIAIDNIENFSKLLPASKLTMDLLTQNVVGLASKFEKYIKDGENANTGDSDLNPEGVDAQEPDMPE